MATLVFLHAHPDDESIATGGSMAKYAAAGHRVVLVVATDGRHGEVPADLAEGETLADRRRAETERSAEVLGLAAVHWLGYEDSGMNGWDQNEHPSSFYQAPLDEAAERLAQILRDEQADVLVAYDWHGGYGHPDHIKVHHVGHRAAVLAGTQDVFESTMNRDVILRQMAAARESGESLFTDVDEDEFDIHDTDDGTPFGMPEADITTSVDVRDFVEQKRASMACHASQITDSSFFLKMPPEVFREAFGTEWFIHRGVTGSLVEHELV